MRPKISIPDSYLKMMVEACRFLVGAVFIFSGFVKAVDPLGTAYKIEEYLSVGGLNAFGFMALPASFVQLALEFVMGVCLIAGVYRKINSLLALLVMCFMTPLTLYLAIANPVTDCGCFGDALVISNWQTFFKNIPLTLASILIFWRHKQMTAWFSVKSRSLVLLYSFVFVLGVSLYCYANLPILDFRPYKIGNNIVQLMKVPENAEKDVFETKLIYEKDGKQQEFTLDNYPQGDSAWKFVDAKSKLIRKGYEPPIHGFTISDAYGADATDEILSDPNYVFLLIAHKLEQANDSHVDKINDLYDYAKQNDYCFLCLTASLPSQIEEWKAATGARYPFYTMDDVTLRTIIRSNPGLVLIKNAVIINKWPDRKIPGEEELVSSLEDCALGYPPASHKARNLIELAGILIVPLLILAWFDFYHYRRKKSIQPSNV
ncbi:MAG: DoxX family protein [Candidatus Azobacteroides sp.]|nr:DoxX family protein [Candidatus Azobacteroides sp.]